MLDVREQTLDVLRHLDEEQVRLVLHYANGLLRREEDRGHALEDLLEESVL